MGEKRLKILIIDDEDVVRELVSDMIESLGYEAIGFADPKKGIDFYKNNWGDIAVVLLDMIMPGLNGRETFFLLKNINRDIKSIILSGFSVNEDIEKILKEGCYAFLKKPVKVHELEKTITRVLNSENISEKIVDEDDDEDDDEIISFSEYNLDEGLDSTGMNPEIFVKMLKRFVENYSDAGEKVLKLLKERKYNELFVFSHSIKSIAAGIGLSRLKAFSEIIESSCLEKNFSEIESQSVFFYKEIENSLDRVKTYLDKMEEDKGEDDLEEQEVPVDTMIVYLNKLLKTSKKGRPLVAMNIFKNSILPTIAPYLDVDFKYRVAAMIKDYDLKDLAEYLQEVINSLNKGDK